MMLYHCSDLKQIVRLLERRAADLENSKKSARTKRDEAVIHGQMIGFREAARILSQTEFTPPVRTAETPHDQSL